MESTSRLADRETASRRHRHPRHRWRGLRRASTALLLTLSLLVPALAADAAPEPPSAVGVGGAGQRVTATPGFSLDPDGADIVVNGTGFTAAAGFNIATSGLYVSLCVDNGPGVQPTPCVGGVDMEGETGNTVWLTNNPLPGAEDIVLPIAADGSFTAELTLKAADEFIDCLSVTCALFVRRDHRGTSDRSQDVRIPVRFVGQRAPVTFTDVAPGGVHAEAIGELAARGILTGITPTTFGPGRALTRGQMASLIARTMGIAPDLDPVFTDVPSGYVHAGAINALARRGIVNGVTATTFDPARPIRRDQAASLLARWLELPDGAPDLFSDVDPNNVHAPKIGALVEAGIVNGFNDGTYRPGETLRRDQAASLLLRTSETIEVPADPFANPRITVSKTENLSRHGETITVTGKGFDPAANASTRPPVTVGQPAGVYVVFGKFADVWQPSEGAPTSARTVIFQRWALPQASLDQVSTSFPSQAPQLILLNADGTFEVELEVSLNEVASGNYGVYVFPGSGAVNAAHELATLVTFAPEMVPAIEVFRADGETPVEGTIVRPGDELVVKGTGFDPQANVGGMGVPIPNHLPQGTFVVFGSFAEHWRPSEGAGSATRVMHNDSRRWALAESVLDQVPTEFRDAILAQWAPLEDDGSFTTTLTVTEPATPLANGIWGVYTYAGGVNTPPNAAQELAVPVTYISDTTPQITVSKTELLADGETITVTGKGFDPAANASTRPPVTVGQPAGVYVVFGKFADVWQPSEGAPTSARTVIFQRWALPQASLDQVSTSFPSQAPQLILLNADGTFEVELEVSLNEVASGNYGVYVFPGSGAVNAAHELEVLTSFGHFPEASISWGVRDSFRTYVEGSIAQGSITTSAGAVRDGNTFVFSPGSGTYDEDLTVIAAGGTVTFTGHGGVLYVSFTNLRIELVEDGTSRLVVDAVASDPDTGVRTTYLDVHLADLVTDDVTPTEVDGTVTYTGVTTTLTEDGVPAFAGFYDAGEALDPITFSFRADL